MLDERDGDSFGTTRADGGRVTSSTGEADVSDSDKEPQNPLPPETGPLGPLTGFLPEKWPADGGVIRVAGVPGAGKTTFGAAVCASLPSDTQTVYITDDPGRAAERINTVAGGKRRVPRLLTTNADLEGPTPDRNGRAAHCLGAEDVVYHATTDAGDLTTVFRGVESVAEVIDVVVVDDLDRLIRDIAARPSEKTPETLRGDPVDLYESVVLTLCGIARRFNCGVVFLCGATAAPDKGRVRPPAPNLAGLFEADICLTTSAFGDGRARQYVTPPRVEHKSNSTNDEDANDPTTDGAITYTLHERGFSRPSD